MATTGVVTVGRRQYVSGMYWENSPSGRISQAAKEAARQPGSHADFFATRSGNKQGRVPQFGLASAGVDVKAGLPSLAACLANQQPGSWIGAFRLREGSALVVVRDDLIVPDGDLFFVDEVEARDRLYQEMAIGGFQRIYAPDAWGVPGADTMPVTLLLNDKTDVRISSVEMSKQAKLAMLVGGSVLLVVLGAGWYIQDQKAKEVELKRQQVAALEKMRKEAAKLMPGMKQKPDYPPPERKWEKHPRPLEILAECQAKLEKVSLKVAGWEVSSIRCSSAALTVNWVRTEGHSNPPPGSALDDSVERAVLSVPFEKLAPRGDEQLVDPEVVSKRYLNQNWPANIKREPDDPPPPPPPGYKGEWNPPPPPWVKRSFTFAVPVLPWTVPSFLEGIPGIIIKSIGMVGDGIESKDSWKIEGVIYENRR